jgi:hypothetical protein
MKKPFTFLFAATLFALNTDAQLFQNTIGKPDVIEYGESISQAADSSYLIAGDYSPDFFASNQPYIIRLKKNGSIEWSKKIVVPGDQFFLSISHAEAVKAATRPDGYIMVINYTSTSYVVRLNSSGAVTWARQLNYSVFAERIKPSYDFTGTLTGFIVLANNSGGANAGAIVMKLGVTGNTLWQKRITHNVSGTTYRFADIKATTDGGCIAAGNIYQNYKLSTPVVFKISSIGTVLWRYSYIFNANNEPSPEVSGITVTNTGYAITGTSGTGGNLTFSINSVGLINWAFKYTNGSPFYQRTDGSAITADAAGNLIVACLPEYAAGHTAAIFKLTPAGVVMWAKKLNSTTALHDIKLTNTNTYCAVGYAGPGNGANISAVNISSTGSVNAGCQPTSLTLTTTAPFAKLIGAPTFSVVNGTFLNAAVTVASENIQTIQSLCSSRSLEDITATETSSNKLQVANDLSGQRVVIKWLTNQNDNSIYEATLYNNFGQPVTNITLAANQAAYIPMNKMQTGVYSVAIKQNARLITRGKVVWVR